MTNDYAIEQANLILKSLNSPKQLMLQHGRKYTRIVSYDAVYASAENPHPNCSAWGFIDPDGRILKAAGWSTPAKNFSRGTIVDLTDPQKVKDWQYGVA